MEALILAALAAVVYWGLCTARERQRGCPGGRGGTETVPAAEKEPWDPEAAAAALEPAPAGLLAVMDHPELGGPGGGPGPAVPGVYCVPGRAGDLSVQR